MANSFRIKSLDVAPLNIPLREPFGIASGSQDVARNLLVTVTLEDGTRGYGEAAPLPPFNGETQEMAEQAIDAARERVIGADIRHWRRIAADLRNREEMIGSAQCALESAILDALTRAIGLPLWAFFGGVGTRLETDMTVPTGDVAHAADSAQKIIERGIRTIKIKIGSGDPQLDFERVLAVHEAAPTAPILLDGNRGYTAEAALALLAELRKHGVPIALFEQPVDLGETEIANLRQITQNGGVPVAADESATSAAKVLTLVQEQAVNVVNIKLMKCGIAEALDIVAICRAAGVRLMIGGMVESLLAMTTSACFAAGLGGFDFVDLDTPMFLAENPFEGGFVQQGGLLDLSHITSGHGVTPLQNRPDERSIV